MMWRIRGGSLQKIADAYVPFWLFRVRYEMAKALQTRLFAMEVVEGALDLFEFAKSPNETQVQGLVTTNYLRPALNAARAEELLRQKVLRIVFQQGFFKLRQARLEVKREAGELYLPYWLGFYGRDGRVRCRVFDAIRRRMEGSKASAFFEEWLAA